MHFWSGSIVYEIKDSKTTEGWLKVLVLLSKWNLFNKKEANGACH